MDDSYFEALKQDEKTEIEIEVNKLKCAFCNKHEATESITDSETLREVEICLECDRALFCDCGNELKEDSETRSLEVCQDCR